MMILDVLERYTWLVNSGGNMNTSMLSGMNVLIIKFGIRNTNSVAKSVILSRNLGIFRSSRDSFRIFILESQSRDFGGDF